MRISPEPREYISSWDILSEGFLEMSIYRVIVTFWRSICDADSVKIPEPIDIGTHVHRWRGFESIVVPARPAMGPLKFGSKGVHFTTFLRWSKTRRSSLCQLRCQDICLHIALSILHLHQWMPHQLITSQDLLLLKILTKQVTRQLLIQSKRVRRYLPCAT